MQIERRKRRAFGNDGNAVNILELRQQRLQFRLNFAHHPGAAPGEQRRITNELDGVAKPLLGVQQDGLAGDWRLSQP